MEELQVELLGNILALWIVLMMHHHTGVKENAPALLNTCLFWFFEMLNVSNVTTVHCFLVSIFKPMPHPSLNMIFRNDLQDFQNKLLLAQLLSSSAQM